MRAIELAEKLGACDEGIEWLQDNDIETVQEAWDECERGDWMLWLAQRSGVDIRPLTLAKARCAATVEHLMDDDRSLKALETARRFGQGRATREELKTAADAAYAAARAAADAYATDASNAAYAAARADAAYTAWATSAAACAAADAAYAAARADPAAAARAAVVAAAYTDAAYASADAERKKALLVTAEICRQMLTKEVMEKVLDILDT